MNIVDYISATFTATAGTIWVRADAGMPTSLPYNARSFKGKLETAEVRCRGDGTAPTATEGEVISVGDTVYLSVTALNAMSFIRTGGTSGVLKGHLYDVPITGLPGYGN